jgi:hypothetical protein
MKKKKKYGIKSLLIHLVQANDQFLSKNKIKRQCNFFLIYFIFLMNTKYTSIKRSTRKGAIIISDTTTVINNKDMQYYYLSSRPF